MTELIRTQDRPAVQVRAVSFWNIAFAFLVGMAFSTLPTPLYPLYAERDNFSMFVVTVVFAVYAVGVIVSLLLAGHISDWVGRRKMMLIALVLEIVAAAIFLLAQELPGLLIARFVTGIGVGMLSATATAYLHELHGRYRPGHGSARSEIVSTAANIGGLGVGPLVAGALAEYVSGPLTVPYVVFIVLLVLSVGAVLATPETVDLSGPRPPYRPQRPGAAGLGRGFWQAAIAGFVAFSVFGVFTSVAPGFVAGTMGEPSRFVAGGVAFVVFAAAALAQSTTSKLPLGVRLTAGVVGEVLGLGVTVVAMLSQQLPMFVLGGAIAGAAAGLLFKAGVGTVLAIAPADQRGSALASMFLISYLGLIVPVLAMGIAVQFLPATTALVSLSGVLIVFLLVLVSLSTGGRSAQSKR
ncbi:MFS transporter [Leucobacter sp. 1207-22]|uniref:MFS transporter n=1 Tax=Leucobacter sp. 1207-22 TaxID=2604456 RepID=UPI00406360D8